MDRYTVSVTPSGDSLLDRFMKQQLPPEIGSDGVTSVKSLNSIPEMKVSVVRPNNKNNNCHFPFHRSIVHIPVRNLTI